MNTKQITLGMLVVAAGVLVLLSNMNIAGMRSVVEHWWPLIIIAVGAVMLWNNARNYVWSIIVMLLGGALLLHTTGAYDVDFGTVFWPLVIVGIGLSMVSGSVSKASRKTSKNREEQVSAILGGSSSKNISDDYAGGSVTALMGGVELDLSKAVIKKEATLSVSVIMGGIELRVAENVVVKNRTTSLMGGLEDKSSPQKSSSAPVLYIEGSIIMGVVEIKR